MINQPEKPEEDNNSEEAETLVEPLSIRAVFSTTKMLENFMALDNVNLKVHFEEIEKK